MPERSRSQKHSMSPAADSAGIPFEGREFRRHPFAGDDGSTPDELAEALDSWARSQAPSAVVDIVEALRTDRILVPLIAEAGDIGYTPEGSLVEKTQELSIVTVEGPDGTPVGLIFSDVASLSAWRADARPQPAEAARAAAWALEAGLTRLVINPTTPSECVLRRGALVSLITGQPYLPPWEDPEVLGALEGGLGDSGVLVSVRSGWAEGPPPGVDLIVEVGLEPGLDQAELATRQRQWAEAWAGQAVLNQRVDGVRLALVAL